MALGIRHAVDDRTGAEAVVAPAPTERPGADEALELHFDARGPLDTWAVARPWLA